MDADHFAKNFYTQQPIGLAFMQDGANTLQAGYAASPMQSAVGVFATNAAISNGTPQLSPSAISVSVRTYGNPTQSYPEFFFDKGNVEKILGRRIFNAHDILRHAEI